MRTKGTPFEHFTGKRLRDLRYLHMRFLESDFETIEDNMRFNFELISKAQLEGKEEEEYAMLDKLYSYMIFLETFYMNHSEWAKIERLLTFVNRELERLTKRYEMREKYVN